MGGVGTGYIRAPEVDSGVYGKSADVFAFGFLVWMSVASADLPMPGTSPVGSFDDFNRLEPKRFLPTGHESPKTPQPTCMIPSEVISEGCPERVVSIMCSCWNDAPNRPTF